MNSERCRQIFIRMSNTLSNPTPELDYTSSFELLIAVILSAQATDVSVNKATCKLYPIANTPKKICELGINGLIGYIKSIGLYRVKAKHIIETCNILINSHGGQVPSTREYLEKLPGVGRKTANVILNTAFGMPVIAVDTHVFRVANRTGMAPGKKVEIVEQKLMKIIPKEFIQCAHHWLIFHGRYTCIARKPLCWKCSINDLCDLKDKPLMLEKNRI